MTGNALRRLYEDSHIAVSTLALHRKGLSSASELKAREYCAIAIPFIACGDDPDFPHDQPFRVRVANDDRPDDVVAVMADFGRHHQRFDDAAQRRYAVDHSTGVTNCPRSVSPVTPPIRVLMVTGACHRIRSGGLRSRLIADRDRPGRGASIDDGDRYNNPRLKRSTASPSRIPPHVSTASKLRAAAVMLRELVRLVRWCDVVHVHGVSTRTCSWPRWQSLWDMLSACTPPAPTGRSDPQQRRCSGQPSGQRRGISQSVRH
jgi:hypothetical protein